MRRSAFALAFVLVATLGIAVPSVSAATGDPKVVIIVGATHGATAGYRADADVAYAEARKYTSNVVKVYSPNATWAAVKAAVVGASVVIYMGHGNGWPSPYASDPTYSTKDGFGLNATAGAGDYNVKYYGEPYMATLDLAPGAIVVLNHLCYASGNSEPGNAEPTVSVARQRADNYAAGFLKAGASAVIAAGHGAAGSYLRALFTTHQSIEDMWRAIDRNGNVVTFPSSRTSGAVVFQDPITPTTGFYRSLAIGSLGVTTDEVISAGYGDTGADPATLLVPGNAAVSTAGGTLYGGSEATVAATSTLPAGTRLRVTDAAGATTVEGAPLVAVQGVDDPSITGFMLATDLAPRDSAAPVIRGLDAGGPFSPNSDGQGDQTTIRGRFTESVAWTLRVQNAAADVLFQETGSGATFAVAWDGLVTGHPVPDGTYTVDLTGVDAWANPTAHTTRTLVVDTAAPVLTALTPGAETSQQFSPNGDAVRDTVALTATSNEAGGLIARVVNVGGSVVKQWSVAAAAAGTASAITWDGRTTAGGYAADGTYTLRIAPQDAAGNIGPWVDRSITLVGALGYVTTTKTLFFPNDLDKLSTTTRLGFTLARPMTVSWTVRNAAGAIVRTRMAEAAAAGTYLWAFDGRGSDGAMLPRGRYTSYVTATDGTLTASQTVGFEMDAFVVKTSDSTPGRGQSITVTVTSAEPLTSARLYISQPGVATWSVRMTKTGTYTYKATVRMKTTGRSGMLTLRAKGSDTLGGIQSTTRVFPLH